jgi:hypothetical protein
MMGVLEMAPGLGAHPTLASDLQVRSSCGGRITGVRLALSEKA